VHLEPFHHVIKRQADQSFRLAIHYDSSVESGLSSDVKMRIEDIIVPRLKNFFESALMVRPLGVPILLQRDCTGGSFFQSSVNTTIQCATTCTSVTMCGLTQVPASDLKACVQCNGNGNNCQTVGTDGTGVSNADFILYVSAITGGSCSSTNSNSAPSTVAFAQSCQMESSLDRPIAGSVNFCPSAFTGDNSDDFIFNVAKHELIHALVFSTSLFPFYRDTNGNPRTPRDVNGFPPIQNGRFEWSNSTILTVTYNNWLVYNSQTTTHTVNLMVTPNVVAEGRKHFNCSTLQGVELENQGGGGTELSHWEKRVLGNEIMTGIIDVGAVLSNITLALMEDSGWYQVNYQYGQFLSWGYNEGCTIASGSCYQYWTERQTNNQPIAPFCLGTKPRRCTSDIEYVGSCQLVSWNPSLPREYQYFSNPSQGGVLEIADFCPYPRAFTFTNGRGTECRNATNQPPANQDLLAETYGPNSLCFEQPSQWRIGNTIVTNYGAGCYQFSCSNNQLTLNIKGTSFTCQQPGQVLTISVDSNGFGQYNGQITCPESFSSYCEFEQTSPTDNTDPTNGGTSLGTDSTSTPPGNNNSGSSISIAGGLFFSITIIIITLFI
jgi:leishmanolysin-like peptidase